MLVGRRIDDERVRGVLGDVGDPRIIIDIQGLLPILSAVDGPEDAPFGIGPPEVAHGGDEDDIGVSPVDEDPGDVPRLLKPHVRPGLPRVGRLIDAVAYRDAVAAGGFAGPHPDDGRVGRGDGDVPDGDGGFLEEDGRPRRAVVLGFPYPARPDRRVDGAPPALGNVDVHGPPSHDRGPEGAPEELVEQSRGLIRALPHGRDGRGDGETGRQQERGGHSTTGPGNIEARHEGSPPFEFGTDRIFHYMTRLPSMPVREAPCPGAGRLPPRSGRAHSGCRRVFRGSAPGTSRAQRQRRVSGRPRPRFPGERPGLRAGLWDRPEPVNPRRSAST